MKWFNHADGPIDVTLSTLHSVVVYLPTEPFLGTQCFARSSLDLISVFCWDICLFFLSSHLDAAPPFLMCLYVRLFTQRILYLSY